MTTRNTNNEVPPAPGISSRRSACDRCRGQKVRCLRHPKEARCRRCVQADAKCITSSIFRMRNYSGDDVTMRPRRQHSHSTAKTSMPVPASSMGTAETIDLPALHASDWPKDADIPSTALPEINPAIDASSSSSSPSPSAANPPASVAAERLLAWLSMNSSLFNFVTFPAANDPLESNDYLTAASQTQGFPLPQMAVKPSLSGPPTESSNFLGMGYSREGLPVNLNFDDILPTETEPIGIQETYTQKLSQVNSEFLILATRLGQNIQGTSLEMLISGTGMAPGIVQDIMRSTWKFLDVLTSIAGPRFWSIATTAADPFLTDNSSTGDSQPYPSFSFSPILSSLMEDPSANVLSSSNLGRSLSSITTQLLILTCFVHVLRLFVVLFSRIENYLQQVARSDDPFIGPISGLCFARVPLRMPIFRSLGFNRGHVESTNSRIRIWQSADDLIYPNGHRSV